MPTAPESHHVPDKTELWSADASFCDIQKVPSIPEKQKSKRSEESQIVTSSPYKQSLLDRTEEQKTKPKRKCSANRQKAQKAKVAPKDNCMLQQVQGVITILSVQCVTDFEFCFRYPIEQFIIENIL